MSGKLYIVATPIGNLSDISLRALETLKQVDIIACEDTRVTAKLLARYEIRKELISYHQHSSESKVHKVVKFLTEGRNVALVSDAGTPGVSDPGNQLVEQVAGHGIVIEVIPGPSALAAALSACHFSVQEFIFYGFLPQKKGRQTRLIAIGQEPKAIVLYESVYRIKKLLNELLEYRGDVEICVFRELTKMHETIYRGNISEVLPQIVEKGEFVVIIKGKDGK
jgi:16S rRNA (cytidine1402-2'-O)-methyltransferase